MALAQYGTLITTIGLAQIANAQITQTKVGLEYIALGDGNGAHYVPTQNQTSLVNEVWRGPIAELSIDPANNNRIIIDAIIPVTAGGFTIREIGIFDDNNNLIAVGQYPEKYKPQLSEGVSEETLIHFVIETNNADAVKLTIDPTVIIASRKYVDEKLLEMGGSAKEVQQQLNTHLEDDVKHVTSDERNTWNEKVDKNTYETALQEIQVSLVANGDRLSPILKYTDKAVALKTTVEGRLFFFNGFLYTIQGNNASVILRSYDMSTGMLAAERNFGRVENATNSRIIGVHNGNLIFSLSGASTEYIYKLNIVTLETILEKIIQSYYYAIPYMDKDGYIYTSTTNDIYKYDQNFNLLATVSWTTLGMSGADYNTHYTFAVDEDHVYFYVGPASYTKGCYIHKLNKLTLSYVAKSSNLGTNSYAIVFYGVQGGYLYTSAFISSTPFNYYHLRKLNTNLLDETPRTKDVYNYNPIWLYGEGSEIVLGVQVSEPEIAGNINNRVAKVDGSTLSPDEEYMMPLPNTTYYTPHVVNGELFAIDLRNRAGVHVAKHIKLIKL